MYYKIFIRLAILRDLVVFLQDLTMYDIGVTAFLFYKCSRESCNNSLNMNSQIINFFLKNELFYLNSRGIKTSVKSNENTCFSINTHGIF